MPVKTEPIVTAKNEADSERPGMRESLLGKVGLRDGADLPFDGESPTGAAKSRSGSMRAAPQFRGDDSLPSPSAPGCREFRHEHPDRALPARDADRRTERSPSNSRTGESSNRLHVHNDPDPPSASDTAWVRMSHAAFAPPADGPRRNLTVEEIVEQAHRFAASSARGDRFQRGDDGDGRALENYEMLIGRSRS